MIKLKLLFLFSLIFFSYMTVSQTVLFSEDFDEADGDTTGTSTETIIWTAKCDSCVTGYYEVKTNEFKGSNTKGPADFLTASITIPAGTKYITISMDYNSPGYVGNGNLEAVDEAAGNCSGKVEDALTPACKNWDFLFYEMIFDGGSDTTNGVLLGYKGTPNNGSLCNATNVEGKSTFTLNIKMALWAGTEWMTFDNIKVTTYTSAQATTDSIPSSTCPITQGCNFAFSSGSATCDTSTTATDTYTATFNYTGGNSGETHTITASSGTVVRTNDPDTVASGKITVTGINEGTNVTLTVNTTACGDTTYTVNSPTCEPTCDVNQLVATAECRADSYDLKIKFKHENTNSDSVNIFVFDGTNNIDSLLNVKTTGDTQTTTLTFVSVGDGTTGLSIRVVEISGNQSSNPFISELHYDNSGGDVNEGFEISGVAGTDLTGWSVVLYNGGGGGQYSTVNLTGTIDDEGSGSGALSFTKTGIQNGAPDGLALVNASGTVIEFISYEGTFAATNGPANGMNSTDMGVTESGTTLTTESLQKNNNGWQAPAASTFGTLNTSLTISSSTVCSDTISFDEPNCCDSLSIDGMPDTSVCGFFILPVITGNNLSGAESYYTEPNAQGTQYAANDTITATDTLYIYDSISSTCNDADTFIITIDSALSLGPMQDTTVCGLYILPAIEGTNLSDSVAYYTQPNGKGTKYIEGDTLLVAGTYYVYDSISSSCFDLDSFTLMIVTTPMLDSMADTSVCDYYILPVITGVNLTGNEAYYTQPNAQGTKFNASDTIQGSTVLYLFDSVPSGCFDLDSFTITIDTTPLITAISDTFVCDFFVLPAIGGTNLTDSAAYYTQPNGNGIKYNSGDTITGSKVFYLFDSVPSGCFYLDSFSLTIDTVPDINDMPDTSVCGFFILPVITGNNLSGAESYYTEPNAQGVQYVANDTITATDTLYIYDSISSTCNDADTFIITIDSALSLGPMQDTTVCGVFILPAIEGTNLSDSAAYYTQPNGKGTKYIEGDTLLVAGTYYVYDSISSSCFDLDSFTLTIDNNLCPASGCLISEISVTTECIDTTYGITISFIHESSNTTDSVHIYLMDGLSIIDSFMYVSTTGDTQTVTLSYSLGRFEEKEYSVRIEEASTANLQNPFISEIHYDNAGTDENEMVEIIGKAGFDISSWSVVLYNGNNGTAYKTINLSGTIDDTGNGFGALVFSITGAQNGSPDGIALVNATGELVEFLSYEGSFTATDGPANGVTSIDIGISESSTTLSTESLQKTDSGWIGPTANTVGAINSGLSNILLEGCFDTANFIAQNCCGKFTNIITNPGAQEDSFDLNLLNIVVDTNFIGEIISYHSSVPTSVTDNQNILVNNILYDSALVYIRIIDSNNACFSVDSIAINIVNLDNNLPIATPDSFAGNINDSIVGNIMNNDVDYDKEELTIKITKTPENGTLKIQEDGKFVYFANNNFVGLDYFLYEICDKEGCDTARVEINIQGYPPIGMDDYYYGTFNQQIDGVIYLNDTSVDGSTLTYSLLYEPTNGILDLKEDGRFTYFATTTVVGLDSFTYMVCNPLDLCDTATVYIRVNCENFSTLKLGIPQVLSPNGDGINDVWKIPSLYNLRDCYKTNEVIIFNRWANKVFYRLNYGFDKIWWNGKSDRIFINKSNNLPPGTYYYIITFGNNWNRPLAGFIHIHY